MVTYNTHTPSKSKYCIIHGYCSHSTFDCRDANKHVPSNAVYKGSSVPIKTGVHASMIHAVTESRADPPPNTKDIILQATKHRVTRDLTITASLCLMQKSRRPLVVTSARDEFKLVGATSAHQAHEPSIATRHIPLTKMAMYTQRTLDEGYSRIQQATYYDSVIHEAHVAHATPALPRVKACAPHA
jgi:hypothetical protein